MQKGKMKKAAVIMMAVTMLLPSGMVTQVHAEQEEAGEKKAIEISLANDGGQMTVTDADGVEYTVNDDAKETIVSAEVGSELTVDVSAGSGYEIEDIFTRNEEGDDSIKVTDKSHMKTKVPVTEDITGIRVSFVESEAADDEDAVIDYGNTEGTLKFSVGKNGSVTVGGVTHTNSSGNNGAVTYDAGTALKATIKADAGYVIEDVFIKNADNGRVMGQVINYDSASQHVYTFHVYGGINEVLEATFVTEPESDPFEGVEGTKVIHSEEDSDLTRINDSTVYYDADGNMAYCGNPKLHGPGRSGTSMKLDENNQYQSAFDYVLYYGYPKRTTILGNALSKKDAHDVTQLALWFVNDPDYSGASYQKMSENLRSIARELAARANAYDGKNADINGTATIYYSSDNKKQPMVVINDAKKVQNGKVGVAKVSTEPSYTDGNPYYSFDGAQYTIYAAEDIGSSYKKGARVATLTTNVAGVAKTKNLPFGSYTVKETKNPDSYEMDTETYTVKVAANGTSENLAVATSKEKPRTGYIQIEKSSGEPDITTGNRWYSMEGTEYTVYAADNIGTKYAAGDVVTKLVTDAKGYAKSGALPFGDYMVKETKNPKSYHPDENEYPVTLKDENSGEIIKVVKSVEPPKKGWVELDKSTKLPNITDNNRCYTLAGAEYTVYAAEDIGTKYKKGDAVTKIVTDENGHAKSGLIPFAEYTIKETGASRYYMTDLREYGVLVCADQLSDYAASGETPSYDPAGITLFKLDKDAGNIAQGSASLAGAQFTVRYYDTLDYTTAEGVAAKEKPFRTWVFETKEETGKDGKLHAVAKLSDAYKVSGDALFVDADGNPVLPVGTITVEETKAPEGYLLEGRYLQACDENGNPTEDKLSGEEPYFAMIRQEDRFSQLTGGNYYAQSDKVKRGDILLQKKDDDSKVMAKIPFEITSYDKNGEEIEKHTIWTDENGYYASSSDFIPHTENTNAGDTNDGAEEAGTWFGIAEDGSNVEVEDERGAFPYGNYRISELSCEANKGMNLIDTTFRVSRDVYEIDLGTYVDHSIEIGTTATDEETGSHFGKAREEAVIIDRVQYAGLEKGKEYTLETKLMNKATGEAVTDADGNPVTVTGTFTPKMSDGYEDVEITFDATQLAGGATVVFEYLYEGETLLTDHADINDEGQTVRFPEIGTTAKDDKTGTHQALAEKEMTITDTVAYHGLIPGKKYTVTGTMMDKETGKAVTLEGAAVTSTAEFTAESADGTVDLTFTFDGSLLAGKTIVAFESVSYKGNEIAVHADIEDEDQTIIIPKIGTTVKDSETNDHIAYADDKIELIDTVSYENLIPGKTYRFKGVLIDKETKEALQFNGEEVRAEAEITPEEATGTVDVTFAFDGKDLAGKDLVVFEKAFLVEGTVEAEIANHEDINDEGQTIHLPKIGTTATDEKTGTHLALAEKKMSIKDTVSYSGLLPGKKYKMTGTLMDKETGKTLTEGKKEVTAETEFTPEKADGTVELTFNFDGSLLAGKTVVAFETVSYEGKNVAVHADINDEEQSVHIPKIGTQAKDAADNDQVIKPDKKVTVTDTVSYQNLIKGQKYTVTGTLMDQKTGKAVENDGKTVTAEVEFEAAEADGTVEVSFTFDASDLGGHSLVVFEKLFDGPRNARK